MTKSTSYFQRISFRIDRHVGSNMGGVSKRKRGLIAQAKLLGQRTAGKKQGKIIDDRPVVNDYEFDLDERELRATLRAQGKR